MRFITSLAIASIAGSVLVGGFRSFMEPAAQARGNPVLKVSDLYRKDQRATTRLIEQASVICMPDLKRIQSDKTRNVVARVIIFVLEQRETRAAKLKSEETEKQVTNKILLPMLREASQSDMEILSRAISQTKDGKSEVMGCIARTVLTLAEPAEMQTQKPLFSDTKLRGS